MVAAAMLLHGAVMVLNEVFFRRAEFLQGIGWIYIPAGTRLLCVLLFVACAMHVRLRFRNARAATAAAGG